MPENLKPSWKGTRPEGPVNVEDTDYRGEGIQARALPFAGTRILAHDLSSPTFHITLSSLTELTTVLHRFVAKLGKHII